MDSNRVEMSQGGGAVRFAYQWVDVLGKPQAMAVTLNTSDISRGSTEFTAWDKNAAGAYAVQAVKDKAKTLQGPGLTVFVDATPDGYRTRMRGPDTPQMVAYSKMVDMNLETTYREAIAAYAATRFYTARAEDGHKTIITPDHVTLARRYAAAMGPVATALTQQVLKGQGDGRAFMNAALGWLQSIPYDRLQDRSTSNGAGFQTPYGLMLGNKGDCDTKATAFLALMRAAYPTLPLAMVYIPNHAFVGVGVPQGPRDFALATAQGTFVLADPTGPARSLLGDIDPEVQEQLRQRHTQIAVVP